MKKLIAFFIVNLSILCFVSLNAQEVYQTNVKNYEYNTIYWETYKISFQIEMTVKSNGSVQAAIKFIDVKHPKAWSNYCISTEVNNISVIKNKKTNKTSAIKYSYKIKFSGRRIIYQIPIESDWKDESKWINKGPSDKDDTKIWEQKNVSISFPAGLFTENIENYYGENDEYNSNNNPPTTQNERKIDLSPITLTNINTFESEPNECQLKVLVSEMKNGNEYPVPNANVTISIDKNVYGTLSSGEGVTGADGYAYFTYTSPKEEELNKTGKSELEVTLKATDVKSGKASYLLVHIRGAKTDLLITADAKILPAHPKYYDKIKIIYKGASKKDGKPYKLKINLSSQFGRFTNNDYTEGGVNEMLLDIEPHVEQNIYYHWTGTQPLDKAEDEVLTFEMPELEKKVNINLSIGIDLVIISVERENKNTPAPYVFEPFYIFLEDKFHPEADLKKIFDDLNLTPKVSVFEYSYETPGLFDQKESDIFNSLWSKVNSYLQKSLSSYPSQLFYNAGFMAYGNNKFFLMEKTKMLKNIHEMPGVCMFDRGKYNFIVSIEKEDWDANTNNNDFITNDFLPEGFTNEYDELAKRVVIPNCKMVMGLLPIFSKFIAGSDLGFAVGQGSPKGMITACFDLFCGTIEKYTKTAEKIKEADDFIVKYFKGKPNVMKSFTERPHWKMILQFSQIASMCNSSIDMIFQYKNKGQGSKFAYNELPKELEYIQGAIKGSKNFYIFVLEKKGLKNYQAKSSEGQDLEKIPPSIFDSENHYQRIQESSEFIIIPALLSEQVFLNLEFNGNGGRIIRISQEGITSFNYPSGNAKKKITVKRTGDLKFTD